jgi:hypothetical protein
MSQNDRIASYLKAGKTLTPLQALAKFDCWALSSRVSDLNKRGMDVKMDLVKKGKKQFAKYYI